MSYNSPIKKSEYITFRTDKATKETLAAIAEPKKWSISQLVEDIVQQWLKENLTDESDNK